MLYNNKTVATCNNNPFGLFCISSLFYCYFYTGDDDGGGGVGKKRETQQRPYNELKRRLIRNKTKIFDGPHINLIIYLLFTRFT